jgi:L-alanine-DL-glutamate epimerase-like enolase superfamily enzyme
LAPTGVAARATAGSPRSPQKQIPITYYKEYDVPLLMTIPNCYGAESFDWVDGLITHPIRMEDGFAYPTDAPGWGFSFKEKYLREIR